MLVLVLKTETHSTFESGSGRDPLLCLHISQVCLVVLFLRAVEVSRVYIKYSVVVKIPSAVYYTPLVKTEVVYFRGIREIRCLYFAAFLYF